MSMLIVCPVCGLEYDIPKTAIAMGVWRLTRCPTCYPPDEPAEVAEHTDDGTQEAA